MRVKELLRERHPELMAVERRAWRRLESARQSGDRLDEARAAWDRVHAWRVSAENDIRAELGLPLLKG